MRDASSAHREGLPVVVLVHTPFAAFARAQAAVVGLPDSAILVYPQDSLARDTDDEILVRAVEVAGRVRTMLVGD